MKSVFRSAFDPVPRTLSPGAQLLVVGVLIVGIAISVVEYLDSSRPTSVVLEQAALPAHVETGAQARPNPEPTLRPRSLVRASSRNRAGTATSAGSGTMEQSYPASVREPSTPALAPMSLQPGGDG